MINPQLMDLLANKTGDRFKSPKRQQVVEYRKNYPEMTLREIGDAVGYTRERIRQILSEENLTTKSSGRLVKPNSSCQTCGNPVPRRRMLYCSNECRHPTGKTTFACANCRKSITVMTSIYKSRTSRSSNIYCGRTCRDIGRKESQ